MALFGTVGVGIDGPLVDGKGVYLRIPTSSDYSEWAELRSASRDFLRPWEPTWAADELSRNAFRRRLRHYQKELREETGYAFFVFRSGDHRLVGGLTISNVRRGVTLSGTIGYWMGKPHAGTGLMTEAVRAVLPFMFKTNNLHRAEAACLPRNLASIRVLEKAGFQREGLARRFLKIDGLWQDHALFARLADD